MYKLLERIVLIGINLFGLILVRGSLTLSYLLAIIYRMMFVAKHYLHENKTIREIYILFSSDAMPMSGLVCFKEDKQIGLHLRYILIYFIYFAYLLTKNN